MTWANYAIQVDACAAALVQAGIGKGDRVGILSENRVEWLIADLAILTAGAVNVPPHSPLTARQICHQLADAGVRWLFVSDRVQREKVESVRSDLPDLQGIVSFHPQPGAGAFSWNEFLGRGRQALAALAPELRRRRESLRPDDLATLMYTSGTTGNPKGVMLSHGNLLSNARAFHEASPRGRDAVSLTWLPFSHIYARTVDHYLHLVVGHLLCLADSVDTLTVDLQATRPTHFSSVPRFYEKVLAACRAGDLSETCRRLQGIFGPRVVWLGSGGAPLPGHVAEGFRDAGLLLLQGYGLTESSPVITFNHPGAYRLESVGRPLPGVEVRIAEDGEILTRGPHVMQGYWNQPKEREAALVDGWLHTGDLGRLDGEGFLYITGRKKELLVLSSGKKVVPNPIEALVLKDPLFDQVVLVGEGRNFLGALVVPNWTQLGNHLFGLGLAPAAPEILANDPRVHAFLAGRIESALSEVAPWERIKQFQVLPRPFGIETGEMTVSMKLRREAIAQKHREEIEAIYGR